MHAIIICKNMSATAQIFVPTSNLQPFINVGPTYLDYLRTSFKANVKLVVRKRNV